MEQLKQYLLDSEQILNGTKAAILFVIGLILARLVSRLVVRMVGDRLERQQAVLLRRLFSYGLTVLFTVAALNQLGFNLGVLLGAAGVVSVAVGFASQTSASNLISGLFLIAEKPFALGDVIQTGGITGEVLSIDLLSVKLRTFDNKFVRIPNETLIKSDVSTLTKFPIRRVDLPVGVDYGEDLDRVKSVLMGVAERHLLCLDEPRPVLFFLGFGDSSIDFQFSVWGTRENFVELKNTVSIDIKKAFDAAGITIPFPQRTLHAGGEPETFPVALVEAPAPPKDPDVN